MTESASPSLTHNQTPDLRWDCGTAYELFLSLHVLHHPKRFGLSPAWAAGVRSRLPAEARQTLEEAQEVMRIPFHWLIHLPAAKDVPALLQGLYALGDEERLPRLALNPEVPSEAASLLLEVQRRRAWGEDDLNRLRGILSAGGEASLTHSGEELPKERTLRLMLDAWSRSADFGRSFVQAVEAYQQVFFAEEERRIGAYLREGLRQAQEQSLTLTLEQLLETLTQGVVIPDLMEQAQVICVPSFWSTPLIFLQKVERNTVLMTFGVRPPHTSLVPGEVVPDALLRALKALADATRLRILRYLAHEELTPTELARRLRLRPPTVVHHLNVLRLAGLVHITLRAAQERHYAVRNEAFSPSLLRMLEGFLEAEDNTAAGAGTTPRGD